MQKKRLLVIIDANSVIHRAFHALPPFTTKKGEPVGAIYGFLLVFFKAIKDFEPDFVAACFDVPGPTFRHAKFKEYKAKRPPAPEDLYNQIPKVKEVLRSFNVPVFEKAGFEADDIIGTIADKAPKKQAFPELETIILSGDKDVLQLVDKNTKVYALSKGVKDVVLYDEELVKEKYGLRPKQLLDYKALRGDPSDNIPGVTGVGEKTATDLLARFNTLDKIYENISQVPDKLKEKLLAYKDQAQLSRELARINKAVPIDFNLQDCQWGGYDRAKAGQAVKELEFKSLAEKLP
ncbi:MAG: hypothetical protein G01um101430_110 [Parcubacteria group bacterium Gr01-1014_30]|nr:MAG: hypothetical protein G01um101430_110 [Parcubacteria group bacterium Gr01-1014_30]